MRLQVKADSEELETQRSVMAESPGRHKMPAPGSSEPLR